MNWRTTVSQCTRWDVTRSFIQDSDRTEVAQFIEQHWGSRKMMSCGQVYDPDDLEGLVDSLLALDEAEINDLLRDFEQ